MLRLTTLVVTWQPSGQGLPIFLEVLFLAQSIIELSRTQDEEVGDGTTSVIILGEASPCRTFRKPLSAPGVACGKWQSLGVQHGSAFGAVNGASAAVLLQCSVFCACLDRSTALAGRPLKGSPRKTCLSIAAGVRSGNCSMWQCHSSTTQPSSCTASNFRVSAFDEAYRKLLRLMLAAGEMLHVAEPFLHPTVIVRGSIHRPVC